MLGQPAQLPENHIPGWFLRFADSNALFTVIPTVGIVVLLIALRLVSRYTRGHASWTDFDVGLQLVIVAIVGVPAATALRVAKEHYAVTSTSPSESIAIGGVILGALVVLSFVLALAAGVRRSQPVGIEPTFSDLAFDLFVPNLAGTFAVMLVLLFASRGGTLHG